MYPILFHIYGTCAIQSYGTAIVIGLLVALWAITRDKRCDILLPGDTLYSLMCGSIIAGVVGGRLLHVISDSAEYGSWIDYLAVWEGGFSILGSVLGITAFVIWFLMRHAIPLLPTMDFLALYAPILQFFGRIGCFFAGCCYGIPTDSWLAIVYTHPACSAPLQVGLHPTQLYSAACYIIIFGILWIVAGRIKHTGQLTMLYLLLASTERFCLDFFRQDRWMIIGSLLSFHQLVALMIIAIASVVFWGLNYRHEYFSRNKSKTFNFIGR